MHNTTKCKFPGAVLDDALITMMDDIARFMVTPILTGKTLEGARNESIQGVEAITGVVDEKQITQQFQESFSVLHPEMEISKNYVKFESNGVPIHLRKIDLKNKTNRKYLNPAIDFFLVGEYYAPNK